MPYQNAIIKFPRCFFASVLVICFIISCRKTDSDSSRIPVSNAPMLSSWYELDTTLPVPYDTVRRFLYSYDNGNRIILTTDLETNAAGDTTYFTRNNFEYHGTDTSSYLMLSYYTGTGNYQIYDSIFYDFANGTRSRDSLIHPGTTLVSRYSYGNQPSWYRATYSTSGNAGGSGIVYQTHINGDIATQVDTIKSENYTQPGIPFYQIEASSFSYVDHPNPGYIATRQYHREMTYSVLNESESAPRHLITDGLMETKIQSGNVVFGWNTYRVHYDYQFRADGYPVSAVMNYYTGPGNATTIIRKIIYAYR